MQSVQKASVSLGLELGCLIKEHRMADSFTA